MYAIYPLLNTVINNISQKRHLINCIVFIVFYFFVASISSGFFYANSLIEFVGIYFVVAYVKKYMQSLTSNMRLTVLFLVVNLVLLIILQLLMNFVGARIDVFSSRVMHFVNFYNPIFIMLAFSLFNIFINLKLSSSIINYISSLTMMVFILHLNILFKKYVLGQIIYYLWRLTDEMNILLFMILFSVALFIASTVVAALYNIIFQKWVHKFVNVLMRSILKIYGKFESLMLK